MILKEVINKLSEYGNWVEGVDINIKEFEPKRDFSIQIILENNKYIAVDSKDLSFGGINIEFGELYIYYNLMNFMPKDYPILEVRGFKQSKLRENECLKIVEKSSGLKLILGCTLDEFSIQNIIIDNSKKQFDESNLTREEKAQLIVNKFENAGLWLVPDDIYDLKTFKPLKYKYILKDLKGNEVAVSGEHDNEIDVIFELEEIVKKNKCETYILLKKNLKEISYEKHSCN